MGYKIIGKKKYFEYDLLCPECRAKLELRASRFGLLYGCTNYEVYGCRGRIGVNKKGLPRIMPEQQKRQIAQEKAAELFKGLWDNGPMNKQQAFSWACKNTGISRSKFFIDDFTIEECELLITVIEKYKANISV